MNFQIHIRYSRPFKDIMWAVMPGSSTLIAMKLGLILMLCTALYTSAAVFSQLVSLDVKSERIDKVLHQIQRQSGLPYFLNADQVKAAKPVTVSFNNLELKEALAAVFKDQPLIYEIKDGSIYVRSISPSDDQDKKMPPRPQQQQKNISGTVTDSLGNPLPGATIRIKSTAQATATDRNGKFSLSNIPTNAQMSVSLMGFQSLEINIANENIFTISLIPTSTVLDETVINAGYYSVSQREATGSISRVTAETIAQQPVNNVMEALIGRMPGVNIEQGTGVSGGNIRIEIRGRNSLRTEAREPLYLIDGVPYPNTRIADNTLSTIMTGTGSAVGPSPLNYLHPADIESIEVLKDGDATAIYGSRGANGVVLITTKKAKAVKSSITVNAYGGIGRVGTKIDLLNTQQYLEMRNEAFRNDGANPAVADYDVNGTWDQTRYTEWQEELIGGTARYTNVQASLNGGNEFTQINFRTNYNRQTTVYPIDYADQKGSGSLAVDHSSANKKFKANFSSTYAIDDNRLPSVDLTNHIALAPNAPALYDPNGNLNWELNNAGAATWTNPLSLTRRNYTGMSNTFLSNGALSFEPLKNLIVKTTFGYNNIRLKETVIISVTADSPANPPSGNHTIANNTTGTWIVEPQLTYKTNVEKGTLDMLLGSTFQSTDQNSEKVIGTGYTSDLLIESISAAPTKNGTSSSSQYRYNALFGRINYNYDGKYIANLTGRRDGSSRFGPGKQFANFGAIGAAWLFAQEKVFESSAILSYGKLRGSYGVTGSDQIGDYGYLDTYSPTTRDYQGGSGITPSRIANADYSWETNKKFEVAMELGFFNDRILFNSAYYRNRSSNQLVGYSLPDITGFPSVQYNLPATVQNTGLEFELNTTNIQNDSFNWNTSFNISFPRNLLVEYPNIKGSSYARLYTVGQSMYTPIGYQYIGVDKDSGLYKFEDVDDNGNDIDDADRTIPASKALANHYYGGLLNSVIFKGFSLDIFVQFTNKTARDPLIEFFRPPGTPANQPVDVLRRWQQPNDETDIQKFSQIFTLGSAAHRAGLMTSSDRFVNASFLRLKTVSLAWNAPTVLVQRLRMNNFRIYVQGQNLLTITKYMGDPEVLSLTALPTLKVITAGMSISL